MIHTITVAITVVIAIANPSATFRLYDGQAEQCLRELRKNPATYAPGAPLHGLGLSVVSNGNPARTCAVVQEARAMGVPAHPALRVYGRASASTIATAKHWRALKTELLALMDCTDGRLSVDAEDYAGHVDLSKYALKARGMTPADLRANMAPFTALLRGLTVGVYPVSTTDEAHAALIESAASAEIWEERTFRAPERVRKGSGGFEAVVTAARAAQTRYMLRFAGVPIRAGLDGDYLRADGFRARERIPETLGPLSPWVWDRFRLDVRAGVPLCSQRWIDSTWYDSRNDVEQAYSVTHGLADGLLYESKTRADTLRKYEARDYGELNNTPLKVVDGWATIPPGQRLEVVPRWARGDGMGDYTVAMTFRLESTPKSGELIVAGAHRKIKSGDGTSWVITLKHVEGERYAAVLSSPRKAVGSKILWGTHTSASVGEVTKGQPVRLVVVVKSEGTVGEVTATLATEEGQTSGVIRAHTAYFAIGLQPEHSPAGSIALSGEVLITDRAWTREEVARATPFESWPFNRPDF